MITFPRVIDGPPIRVSASTFSTYIQCPDAALARLRGEYAPDSPASFRGGLAHRIFARHLTGGAIDEADFAQVCREEIGSSNLNYKMAGLSVRPSDLRQVIEEMSTLYERFSKLSHEGFVGAEVALSAEPAPELELVGSVDAVFEADDSVRLVDWKTGNLGDPEAQLRFYAMTWSLQKAQSPTTIEAVSIRTGERVSFEPNQSSLQHTAERVARLVNEVRTAWMHNSEIARRGGPGCRYCPLLDDCPEGASALTLTGP